MASKAELDSFERRGVKTDVLESQSQRNKCIYTTRKGSDGEETKW